MIISLLENSASKATSLEGKNLCDPLKKTQPGFNCTIEEREDDYTPLIQVKMFPFFWLTSNPIAFHFSKTAERQKNHDDNFDVI